MLGIPFAVMAAIGWGVSAVLVRVGLRYITVSSGTLLSLITSLLCITAAALLFDAPAFARLSPPIVAWFALAGITNFAFGRQFNYQAIGRIGSSRASPIANSSPLFAMLLAVLVLGETINLPIVLGALSIVAGLWMVTTSR